MDLWTVRFSWWVAVVRAPHAQAAVDAARAAYTEAMNGPPDDEANVVRVDGDIAVLGWT